MAQCRLPPPGLFSCPLGLASYYLFSRSPASTFNSYRKGIRSPSFMLSPAPEFKQHSSHCHATPACHFPARRQLLDCLFIPASQWLMQPLAHSRCCGLDRIHTVKGPPLIIQQRLLERLSQLPSSFPPFSWIEGLALFIGRKNIPSTPISILHAQSS